jgi:hypothetical protein
MDMIFMGSGSSTSTLLLIASSAEGTKRTRSCSPTALPSPRQAGNFFFFHDPRRIASVVQHFLNAKEVVIES